jgi:hypothetical protein
MRVRDVVARKPLALPDEAIPNLIMKLLRNEEQVDRYCYAC